MTLLDKTITIADVIRWHACEDYVDPKFDEDDDPHWDEAEPTDLLLSLFDGRESLTILEVLSLDISVNDRLWAVCREDLIPAPVLREFACRAAEWALVLVSLGGAEIDPRSIEAIRVARRHAAGEATDDELAAAWAAAWGAAGAAARAAAGAAAGAAAWDAAGGAAGGAAGAAARAARAAAWGAARAAAGGAAGDIRIAELRELLAKEDPS